MNIKLHLQYSPKMLPIILLSMWLLITGSEAYEIEVRYRTAAIEYLS